MKLKDKVFAVTGAGGGIGGAIVEILIRRGAKVAAIDLKPEGLKALVTRISAPEDSLHTFSANTTDRERVAQLPSEITKIFGAVDGLINVAGIVQPFVKINDMDFDAIERVMNVNFYGTVNMTKAFLPGLLERPEAAIINVSSMGGFLPVPGQSVYGASKAAVKLFTEGLYAELLGSNVHVSVVFPGATATSITANSGVDAPKIASDVSAQNYKMLSPAQAAEIIVTGIQNDTPQIFTGSDSKFMNRFYRLSPIRATKLITKKMGALLK
jgi:short-subunit dehydrogenase